MGFRRIQKAQTKKTHKPKVVQKKALKENSVKQSKQIKKYRKFDYEEEY